jgi:hypothetical protein
MSERVHFVHQGDVYLALPPWSHDEPPVGYERVDQQQAAWILAAWSRDSSAHAKLGGLGQVQLLRRQRPSFQSTRVIDSEPKYVSPELESTGEEKEHWIEILLIGEDDEGMAGVLCEVTLPSGQRVRRTTDRFGLVRIEGITDPRDCVLTFPDLDSDAWEDV